MNYDYKIINTDPTLAFVKRVLLYVCILSITVSLALVVLFVLFERYLMLILPGVWITAAVLTMLLLGKKASYFDYHFTETGLDVTGGNHTFHFAISDLTVLKNSENSDFLQKDITVLTFLKNRIAIKNSANDNTQANINRLVKVNDKTYLLALDDFALALIGGAENER